MLRDPDRETTDGYTERVFILESDKEGAEAMKWAPPTPDLPTTHEHYVTHDTEVRQGQTLKLLRIGVRRKVLNAPVVPAEPDNLNDLSDALLEDAAAVAQVKNYPKSASKAKRVAAIREARKQGAANV
jgi:hypothetical protein